MVNKFFALHFIWKYSITLTHTFGPSSKYTINRPSNSLWFSFIIIKSEYPLFIAPLIVSFIETLKL